jgi:hypothetical protein
LSKTSWRSKIEWIQLAVSKKDLLKGHITGKNLFLNLFIDIVDLLAHEPSVITTDRNFVLGTIIGANEVVVAQVDLGSHFVN